MPAQLSCLHLPLVSGRLTVDRTSPGRILGVSILTTGPAKGHGFDVDAQLVERVAQLGEGIRGRWTHGLLGASALGRHLGEWSNLRTQRFQVCRTCQLEAETPHCGQCGSKTDSALRALGDFAFSESAWKLKPDGLDVPAPDYLMSRAEEDPRSLGVSIVAPLRLETGSDEGGLTRTLARIVGDELLRADWVADPAANPTGLSREDPDPFVPLLDRLVDKKGEEPARLHMFGLLARYFGDEVGDEPAPTESTRDADPALEEVFALRAQLEQVTSTVQRLVANQSEGLLSSLKRQATALGAPVSAEDLVAIEVLLAQGKDSAAQTLATAFLSRAEAKAQVAHDEASVVPLRPTRLRPDSGDSLAAQAQVLEDARGLRSLAPLPSPTPTPIA